jgi:hypothetical protein
VEHGKTIDFTVTPSTGYSIDRVEGCGGSLSGNIYTTGAITADCSVTASFKLQQIDTDNDGVNDNKDQCPATASGTVVDGTGCSIAQLCPCAGPRGTTGKWKNHGGYVSCTAKSAESFLAAGLITAAEKDAIVSAAAKSGCGGK